jgi:hypothetical protein
MPREIYLRRGEEIRVIAGPKRTARPLISEEERKAQVARLRALSQARAAARQLSLGLRHLQGGDPDTKSSFTMEAEGRLSKLPKELQRVGITREQLVAEFSSTYRKALHPPTPEEADDLARAFVDWLPGYGEESGETTPSSPAQ